MRIAMPATAAMMMFRLRFDRSTTTRVSELEKLVSRFIRRIFPPFVISGSINRRRRCITQITHPAQLHRHRCPWKGFFYERRHRLHRRALLQR